MRNLFIPYKDIILEFMETLKNPRSFQVDKIGQILLSTEWDSYNQILISSKMDSEMKTNYLSPTAGLNGINFDSKTHLEQFYSLKNLKRIEELVLNLRKVYSKIDYDPMYLFSILVNASMSLKSEIGSSTAQNIERSKEKLEKNSVFLSAEPRMHSFVEWLEIFKRKTKDELERSVVQEASKLYQPQDVDEQTTKATIFREEQKEFKIRTMKRPTVRPKPLPIIPTSNSLDILLVIREIVYRDYDIRSIARALEIGRDYIKTMILHSNILWEMSRIVNLYQRVDPNLGLSSKEKSELLEQIEGWINLMNKKQPS